MKSSKSLRSFKEGLIRGLLFLAAFSAVVITLGIFLTLFYESLGFFREISIVDFLTDLAWTPANKHFGILSLLAGTFVTTLVALAVAIPFGTIISVYLSEYASEFAREFLKPILELLSAIPSVVYGYFALLVVTPLLQKFIPDLQGSNMLSAGLVMGLMIIPYVASLSEDTMRSVPMQLREGSYALGSTKLQTAFHVVIPSSFSGIASAYILGFSRAIGETMVVAIAAGGTPNLTLNPLAAGQTATAYITAVSKGDLQHGSTDYQAVFAVGLTLFLITFLFNVLGSILKKRYREVY